MGKNRKMKIGWIEKQEIRGRALIYPIGDTGTYYVIASMDIAESLKPGDVIKHKPVGVNFGRFISRKGRRGHG